MSDFGESTDITTSTKTLALADCGTVWNVTTDCTITLPSTAAGLNYIIRNGGSGSTDNQVDISVSPVAADKISGMGLTPADNKDLINTGGEGGDYLQIIGDGVDGWVVVSRLGTWTREA